MSNFPELSIVVPLYNEQGSLPLLLENLFQQQGVDFELILSDGGSSDGTGELLEAAAQQNESIRIVRGTKGRGRQLNRGAACARGKWMLFLHADSLFEHSSALRRALDQLLIAAERTSAVFVAGHFSLRFDSPGAGAYYHLECKARLDRPGCTHGDQGFLMHRDLFGQVGPFDETLPVMEDTLLAEKIRAAGRWVLLEPVLVTSARRFEIEGLRERQTLSALMMNFAHIGWLDFFNAAPQVYPEQDRGERLDLLPFLLLIRSLLGQLSYGRGFDLWWKTGRYVRDNLWQFFFALDSRSAYRRGDQVGCGELRWLGRYERFFRPVLGCRFMILPVALAVRLWFALMLLRLRASSSSRSSNP